MCGAVTYTAAGELRDVWNCHCHRCRQWSGHHVAATRANLDDVSIVGEVRWFSPGPGAEYGFCPHCGSSLFWRAESRPQYLTICAGTLQQPTGLSTTAAWWTAEHGDYHVPTEGLETHDYDG